jgi:hypothetical protein
LQAEVLEEHDRAADHHAGAEADRHGAEDVGVELLQGIRREIERHHEHEEHGQGDVCRSGAQRPGGVQRKIGTREHKRERQR